MTRAYTSLPLYEDSFYSYSTTLENNTYKIKILWNERAESWFYSLYLADNTPLVLGERLVPNYPLISEYSIEGLSGYFLLLSKAETDSEKYITNTRQLSQYYDFYYTYLA